MKCVLNGTLKNPIFAIAVLLLTKFMNVDLFFIALHKTHHGINNKAHNHADYHFCAQNFYNEHRFLFGNKNGKHLI